MLLLEEDERRNVPLKPAASCPQRYARVVIVPDGYPKTKPRACNVGLAQALGEFLVIYDAEDRPEPDQLRKLLAAFPPPPTRPLFASRPKLAYYNQRQNVLTRDVHHRLRELV